MSLQLMFRGRMGQQRLAVRMSFCRQRRLEAPPKKKLSARTWRFSFSEDVRGACAAAPATSIGKWVITELGSLWTLKTKGVPFDSLESYQAGPLRAQFLTYIPFREQTYVAFFAEHGAIA